jgi:hypothetical protein
MDQTLFLTKYFISSQSWHNGGPDGNIGLSSKYGIKKNKSPKKEINKNEKPNVKTDEENNEENVKVETLNKKEDTSSDWLSNKNFTEEEKEALEEIRQERIAYRKRMNANLEKYQTKYGKYWTGPLGIQIPLFMRSVPDLQGTHTVHYELLDDGEIELINKENLVKSRSYTEEKYLKQYAENRDGIWYWKDCDPDDFEVSF